MGIVSIDRAARLPLQNASLLSMTSFQALKLTIRSRLVFALVVAVIGCRQHESNQKVEATPEVIVKGTAIAIEPTLWPKLVKSQGTLIADEVTTVGAKVAGRIVEVPVDLGDIACQDDVLVQLDPKEFQLLLEQADAQLLQARSAVGLKPGDPVEGLNPDSAPPVRETKAVWDEAKKAVERIRQLSKRDAISIAEAAERLDKAKRKGAPAVLMVVS